MSTPARKRASRIWSKINQSCYNPDYPNYKNIGGCGVTVGKEWKTFDDFYEWYVANDYYIPGEYTTINRFILGNGLKEYSPKTCVMLPPKLNNLFRRSNDINSGIRKTNYGYKVVIESPRYKTIEQKGTWDDIHQARQIYKDCKTQYFQEILDDYEPFIPPDLYIILRNYRFKNDYIK